MQPCNPGTACSVKDGPLQRASFQVACPFAGGWRPGSRV